MIEEGTQYIMVIRFVDDSYWDDGNRYTWREEEFDSLKEMWEEHSRIINEGYRAKGQGGWKTFYPDSFEFYKVRTTKLKAVE